MIPKVQVRHAARPDKPARRKPEPGSNFRLAGLATVQGNACPQEFRTCRPVDGAIDTATTQKRTVCRIHNGIHRKLGNVALDNFNLNHNNLKYNIGNYVPRGT